MQTYMSHPKLGGMLVYLDDIEQKQKDGWIIDKKPEKVVSRETIEVETIETPEVAYEKKFGKPPHHKMKLDSIIAALEK